MINDKNVQRFIDFTVRLESLTGEHEVCKAMRDGCEALHEGALTKGAAALAVAGAMAGAPGNAHAAEQPAADKGIVQELPNLAGSVPSRIIKRYGIPQHDISQKEAVAMANSFYDKLANPQTGDFITDKNVEMDREKINQCQSWKDAELVYKVLYQKNQKVADDFAGMFNRMTRRLTNKQIGYTMAYQLPGSR